jgi:hypothetical protein
MAMKPEKTTRWGVYLLRSKGERIGSVNAKTKGEALARASEECEIRTEDRFRVSVRREGLGNG